MSLFHQLLPASKASKIDVPSIVWQRLPQYIVCTIFGLFGGAIGVALAIGLVVVVQLFMFPTAVFSPGVVPVAVAAVLFGLGISWGLGRAAYQIFPTLSENLAGRGMQVVLIFSVLASLLEAFTYMQGL